jgi:hypothetical protein
MHVRAADDDSVPVPHDVFRLPRGALNWKTPYLFVLIGLGGVYGVLVLAGRLSPSLAALLGEPATAASAPLRLPLFVQLASAFSGLAALVLVLARAVREVDKRPYVAIAPVLAVFAGLVHAGLRVDLAPLGASSALVAFSTLAVALIGGALTARDDVRARQLGWGLALAPWVLLLIVLDVAKGEAPFEPAERAYLAGLLGSSLLMGAAGVAARRLRSAFQGAEARGQNDARGSVRESNTDGAGYGDDFEEAKTIVVPAPLIGRSIEHRDTIQAAAARPFHATLAHPLRAFFGSRADAIWQGRGRVAAMLIAVAATAYLSVGGLRRDHDVNISAAAPAAPPPAVTALVVEQLPGSAQLNKSGARSVVSPARAPARLDQPREHASIEARGSTREPNKVHGKSASVPRTTATASAKPSRASRASARVQSGPGLPAWGSETVREFSSFKANDKVSSMKAPATVTPKPAAMAKPTQPTGPQIIVTNKAPTAAAKLVAAAKPVEPPKPAAPPAPSKPLTMDQLLNRVEDAAKTQRKNAGLAPPKKQAVDSDLDALIRGATQNKK